MNIVNIEIIGTVASMLVLVSFLMKGEKRIRVVNILGALLFVVYGLTINAFSVWFLNGSLFFVHLYRLKELKEGGEDGTAKKRN